MALLDRILLFSEKICKAIKWQYPGIAALNSLEYSSLSTRCDIPLPPKRPPTAYMTFCKENRAMTLRENPALKAPDVMRVLAEKWSQLTPELKKPYEETARENTISYGKKHKDFYESLTIEQREILLKFKVEKKENRKAMKLKKALKESGLPKHPKPAFSFFLQLKAREMDDITNGSSLFKQAAEEWKKLSEQEKKVYYEKAKMEKESFEKQISSWKEQEGNLDLLNSYNKQMHLLRSVTDISETTKRKSTKARGKLKNIDDHVHL